MCQPDKERISSYIQGVTKELDSVVHDLGSIELELSTLDKLTKFTESISDKLVELYEANFPKKCNTCGKMYLSRNEFLQATFPLRKTGTVFIEGEVMEHRNCVCGSTLCIGFEDRRDNSSFGNARRELFDICLHKLEELTQKSEKDLIPVVRKVFREIIIASGNVERVKGTP